HAPQRLRGAVGGAPGACAAARLGRLARGWAAGQDREGHDERRGEAGDAPPERRITDERERKPEPTVHDVLEAGGPPSDEGRRRAPLEDDEADHPRKDGAPPDPRWRAVEE